MESSKTRPVSNTLAFSSIFLSLVICFVALVHVEVELHAHRQMLQALSQQRTDNYWPYKTVNDEPISSFHNSDAGEGKKMGERFFINCSLAWLRHGAEIYGRGYNVIYKLFPRSYF